MFDVGNITLGGVDLNDSLQWIDRYSQQPVAQSTDRTLQGGLIVYSQTLTAGRPITLRATTDTGWFTFGMVQALEALAAVAGTSYVFEFWGETYNVRFDHTQGPACQFVPLKPKDPNLMVSDEDYFTGSVKLFTV